LIRDAIRETQGFGLIWNLRRPARGGEWQFCRSGRRIERPANSKNRERRKYCGNAAVNDVTPDSASWFYGGCCFLSFFFGIFRTKFPKMFGKFERSV
jgi:hypothetical protein